MKKTSNKSVSRETTKYEQLQIVSDRARARYTKYLTIVRLREQGVFSDSDAYHLICNLVALPTKPE